MSEQLGTLAGAPDDRIVSLYERFARSGAGLLITGNVMVDRRALGEPMNVVLEGTRHLDAFERWAEAAKSHGSQVWMQINHPGRQVPRALNPHPVGPSAVALRVARGVFGRPRAMREDEIHETIVRFGRSARLAQEAGFDGVQIHGAHGYLVSQFLSPVANRRTDHWGGSLANRMRFARIVTREVRRRVDSGFAVGFKLNCSDFVRGGFSPDDAVEVARMLDDEGVDVIELSGGGYESAAMFATEPRPGSQREAFFAEFAGRLKAAVGTRVMLTGGNRTAPEMARAVRDGLMDVVGIGRPFVAVPDFAAQLLRGEDPGPLPHPRKLRSRSADALVQTAWHERQMHRLAGGREVAPRMSALGTLAWGMRRNTLSAWRVRRRARLDGVAI
jgi:2,4-dienoyl-CoA reductase-like NADH-dependent reductase (Old Yellow Enzyme family)